jgi:hypothetical protein
MMQFLEKFITTDRMRIKQLNDFLVEVVRLDNALKGLQQKYKHDYLTNKESSALTFSNFMIFSLPIGLPLYEYQLAQLEKQAVDLLKDKHFDKEVINLNFIHRCKELLNNLRFSIPYRTLEQATKAYDHFVIPLVDEFWNFKYKLENYIYAYEHNQKMSIEECDQSKKHTSLPQAVCKDSWFEILKYLRREELAEVAATSKAFDVVVNDKEMLYRLQKENLKQLYVTRYNRKIISDETPPAQGIYELYHRFFAFKYATNIQTVVDGQYIYKYENNIRRPC